MKLRSFLYLDTGIINDYIAAIEGGVYDDESLTIASTDESSLEGNAGVGLIKGAGAKTGKRTEQVHKNIRNTDASKFDAVYNYLASDEDDQLMYYEAIPEEVFDSIERDDFLEVLVTARFSRMKEISDLVYQFGNLANLIQPIMGEEVLDNKSKEAIEGLEQLSKINSDKGIACVFEFEDKKCSLIAHLDESYFRCTQDRFLGEGYLLCKVIKKIPKGKKVLLDELFSSIERFASNRQERRELQRKAKNPTEIRDEIKGPALMVLPIAFYR